MSCPAVGASGPSWPQPGHPAVDELRVAGQHLVRPDAEPLGDARPEALDQRVAASRPAAARPRRRPACAGRGRSSAGRGPAGCRPARRPRPTAAGQLVDADRPRRRGRRAACRGTAPGRSRAAPGRALRQRSGHCTRRSTASGSVRREWRAGRTARPTTRRRGETQNVSPFSAFLRSSGFGSNRSPYCVGELVGARDEGGDAARGYSR